ITEVFTEVTEAYESFQFFKFFQTVQNFCVVDLSNFYLDIAKDRLYISAPDAFRRRSCQTILQIALENLAKAIAPVLCHLAEDIWQFLPYDKPCKSVFQAGWLKAHQEWLNPTLAQKWEQLRNLRTEVNKVLETARTGKAIGSSLEAKVLLYGANPALKTLLLNYNSTELLSGQGVDQLRYLLLASQVELVDSLAVIQATEFNSQTDNLAIAIVKADGHKCDRCWNYSDTVGTFKDDPTLCDRCESALKGEF
ncbi:MAG: class I tRNA ligase family protein, partial [Microcystaceae cyanobacterium]